MGMKTILRLGALLIVLAVTAFWFFSGPNLGWSKDSVTHKEKDPVTELEVDRYEKRFVPGVEFLGVGLAVAVVMGGCSFFFQKKSGLP